MTMNTIPTDRDRDVASGVNHPRHYNQGAVEAIDLMESRFPSEPHLFTALKYILRAPHKGAEKEDYRKAAWYVRRRICDPGTVWTCTTRLKHGIPFDDKRAAVLATLLHGTLDHETLRRVADMLEALARE